MRLYTGHLTVLAALLPLLSGAAACDRGSDAASSATSGSLGPFVESMQQATSLTLFEGLPHQVFEAAEFKSELSGKRTVQLHAFPFYEQTLTPEAQAQSKLKAMLTSSGALRPHRPNIVIVKQCGGFHPDYAIQWAVKRQVYEVLVCFGCEEARCYGPAGEARCDLSDASVTELKSILAPYRRERPVTQDRGTTQPARTDR